jgi:hypothetical protein
MSRRNETLDAIIAELQTARIPFEIKPGGKHGVVEWFALGRRRKTTFSYNAGGSWNAPHNARADVRRRLRADGVQL